MKALGISPASLLAGLATARAADLPTTKPPPQPSNVSCFSSLYACFDSTPADCPLTYGGFSVYRVLDYGVGDETHGVNFNYDYYAGNYDYYAGVEGLVSPNSQRGRSANSILTAARSKATRAILGPQRPAAHFSLAVLEKASSANKAASPGDLVNCKGRAPRAAF